jgi:hypothetical protein
VDACVVLGVVQNLLVGFLENSSAYCVSSGDAKNASIKIPWNAITVNEFGDRLALVNQVSTGKPG